MLKLNFATYKGKTQLHDWWKAVQAHLTEIQAAHNALEHDLSKESADRQSADEALKDDINSESVLRENGDSQVLAAVNAEVSARESQDTLIRQEISAEADRRESAVSSLADDINSEKYLRERGDRQNSDEVQAEANLRASADTRIERHISAETSSRQNADNALKADIDALGAVSHTHANAEILDNISADDVLSWRTVADAGSETPHTAEYLLEICRGFIQNFRELYGAWGVTLYDGGTDGEEYTGEPLDGGTFDDTDDAQIIDFGLLGENVFTSAVFDGGQY